MAAALTLAPALAVGLAGWEMQVAATVAVAGASLWSTRRFAAEGADPGWVVVDEAAGTFLAVIGLSGWSVVAAFAIFRIADISKKFPGVAAAEQLSGSLGVTADDLVAGAWALAAGWLVQGLL